MPIWMFVIILLLIILFLALTIYYCLDNLPLGALFLTLSILLTIGGIVIEGKYDRKELEQQQEHEEEEHIKSLPILTYTAEDGEYCVYYETIEIKYQQCSVDKDKMDAIFKEFVEAIGDVEEPEGS